MLVYGVHDAWRADNRAAGGHAGGYGTFCMGQLCGRRATFRRHGVVGNRVFASVLLVGLGVLLVCNGVGL
ncbi:MAG: hypothetical protein R2857_15920 [Vampirovibrionales bacterium]